MKLLRLLSSSPKQIMGIALEISKDDFAIQPANTYGNQTLKLAFMYTYFKVTDIFHMGNIYNYNVQQLQFPIDFILNHPKSLSCVCTVSLHW